MSRRHSNNLRVPGGSPNRNDNSRTVFIGSRAVGGPLAAGLVSVAKQKIGFGALSRFLSREPDPPNPGFHWCVIVGDFYHQLQATSLDGGDNYYDNDRWSSWGSWETYKVGNTTYNDVAIQQAGERAINDMPETYQLQYNNCQSFVVRLLDLISPGRKRVTTSFAVNASQAAPEFVPEPVKMFHVDPETGEQVEVDPATMEPIKEGSKIEQPSAKQPVVPTPEQAEEKLIQEVVDNPEAEPVGIAMLIMNEKTPTISKEEMEKLKQEEVPLVLPAPGEADGSGVLVEGTTSLQPKWEVSS